MALTSIIVRTLNEARYLPELLDGIRRQQGDPSTVETIVVDSGSSDQTLDIAREHKCTIVEISPQSFSFGRSLNLGCEHARGDYLVFVSGHCVPYDDSWLQELLKPFVEPEVGISYGRQLGGNQTQLSEDRIFAKYFPGSPVPTQSKIYCNNANAAVRKTLWQELRFDEELTGLEDMHFAKRAVQQGYRVQYSHTASVYHYHHENWRQIKRRFEREAIALREILPEIHLNSMDALRYFAAAVWSDCSYAAKKRRLAYNIRKILMYRGCQYWGGWKGHHIHRKLSQQEKHRYFYPSP